MRRLRRSGGSGDGSGQKGTALERVSSRALSNVIDFTTFREQRLAAAARTIYYVASEGRWHDLLNAFPFLKVIEIRSNEELASSLMTETPDLILLEANVSWLNPIRFIEEAQSAFEIPIVMICEDQKSQASSLLKEAYAAGLYDVLFAPLKREDLVEMFEALLTLRLQNTSHH